MKQNLKDEPKEWRKSTLLAVFGLALISSLLRWRRHLPHQLWIVVLIILAAVAVVAGLRPRWFRTYHLFSMRLGFAISRILGRVFLTLFFIFVITPMGWLLRWLGKDPLQLKRPENVETYWRPAGESSPLDRLF